MKSAYSLQFNGPNSLAYLASSHPVSVESLTLKLPVLNENISKLPAATEDASKLSSSTEGATFVNEIPGSTDGAPAVIPDDRKEGPKSNFLLYGRLFQDGSVEGLLCKPLSRTLMAIATSHSPWIGDSTANVC